MKIFNLLLCFLLIFPMVSNAQNRTFKEKFEELNKTLQEARELCNKGDINTAGTKFDEAIRLQRELNDMAYVFREQESKISTAQKSEDKDNNSGPKKETEQKNQRARGDSLIAEIKKEKEECLNPSIPVSPIASQNSLIQKDDASVPWNKIDLTSPRMKKSSPKPFPWWIPAIVGGAAVVTAVVVLILKEDDPVDPLTPIARNDQFTVPCKMNTPVSPLANDSGEGLRISAVSGAPVGWVTFTNQSINILEPALQNFTFTYSITDNSGNQATASISIIIEYPPIQLQNQTFQGNPGEIITHQIFTNAVCTECVVTSASAIPASNFTWTPEGNFSFQLPDVAQTQTVVFTFQVMDCCLQTASVQISVTIRTECDIPASFVVVDEECDFGDGSIEIVIDPISNYQFEWSNGNNSSLISGLTKGIYQVTITLISNPSCSEVFNIEVMSSVPTIELSDDLYQAVSNTLLTGNVLNNDTGSGLQITDFEDLDVMEFAIQADGSFRFLADENAEDQYSSVYTVTDICGNTSTAIVQFDVAKLPCDFTATITTVPADCGKANGSAVVVLEPAGSFYEIMWPNGNTGNAASGFEAGSYNLIVTQTENDCVMNFNFNIAENPVPTYIQSLVASPATCIGGGQADLVLTDPMGGMMELNVTLNNNPVISLIVASGAINLGEITNLLPGNYQISVVGAGCPPRCTQIIDFSISEENLEFEVIDDLADIPSNSVWNGNVLTNDNGIGMNVIGYTQPDSGTAIVDSDGSATYTPPAGFSGTVTFFYTVRDTCGQEKSAIVTINVASAPCDFTAQFTNIPADCGKMNGASSVLIIPQGDAYIVNWPDGTQGLSNAMLFAGTYTVSVSDPVTNCTQNFSTTITELPPVDLIQQISTNPGTCLGGGSMNFTLFNPKPMDIMVEIYLDNQIFLSASISAQSAFSGEMESIAAGTYILQVVESGCPLRCADTETFGVGSTDLPMTLTDDSYFISFGDTWQGNILTNDTGTGLRIIDNTDPVSGTLTLNAGGFGTWIPDAGFSGLVSFTYTAQDTCGQQKTATVIIEVGMTACEFTASLMSTPAQCGISNGTAQIMLFPADGVYTISWQGGQTSEVISNLSSGIYLVSVTDQINACTKVFSIEIEEIPIDMIQSVNSQAGNCLGGGEIILDISNGFLTNLMVNITEPDLAVDIDLNLSEGIHLLSSSFNIFPGTYTITVNGPGFPSQCAESVEIIVGDNPLLMDLNDDPASIPFGSVWNGNVLTNDIGTGLEVNEFTESPHGVVQILSNGMATFLPNIGFAGTATFQYIAIDACNQEQTATVTITVLPPPCDFTASISVTPAACGHSNGTATINMSPTDIMYTFVWPDGSSGNSNSQLAGGSHVVSVSAFGGLCEETYEIIVPEQNTTYLTGTVITPATCEGNGNIQITIVNPFGGPLVIVLTNLETNMMNTFDFNPGTHNLGSMINLLPGAYSIVINEPGNPGNCAQTVNVTIPETELPFQLQDDQATISSGETWSGNVLDNDIGTGMIVIEFTQSTNGTVTISPEGNAIFIPANNFSGVATFTYTVTDVCNRIETANVSITVESTFCDYIVTFNVQAAGCGLENGSVTVAHEPADPVIFTWSNGVMGSVNNNIAAGLYMLTLNNQETGCVQDFSVEIPELAPSYIESITVSGPDCDGNVVAILNLSPNNVSFSGTLVHQDGNTAPFMSIGGTLVLSDIIDLIPGNWTVSVMPVDVGPDCVEIANFSVAPDPFIFVEVIEITQPSGPTAMDGGFILLLEGSHPPYTILVNALIFGPFGNGPAVITGLGVGMYEVSAVDINGCQSAQFIIPLMGGFQSDTEQSGVWAEFFQQPSSILNLSSMSSIPEGIPAQDLISQPGFLNGFRYGIFHKRWQFRTEVSFGESSASDGLGQKIYQNSFQTRAGVGWFHDFSGNRITTETGVMATTSKTIFSNNSISSHSRQTLQSLYFRAEYRIRLKSGYSLFWEPQIFYFPPNGQFTGMLSTGFKFIFE